MDDWGFLSYHWIPNHRDANDKAWFALQRPRIVKVVWTGTDAPPYSEDLPADCKYLYRNVSFEYTDLRQDAAGIGHRHAEAMFQAFTYLRAHGLSADRILLENINEYNLWTPEQAPRLAAACDAAFCEDVIAFGGTPVALSLGVGWPGNAGDGGQQTGQPNAPPIWDWAWPVVDVLQRHQKGYIGAHEYWWDRGIDGYGMWGWWAGRILKCPFNVPILITECGIDSYVDHTTPPRLGWMGLPGTLAERATAYVDQLYDYMGRLAADPGYRIQAIMPFTYDIGSAEWERFNVRDGAWKQALQRKQSSELMPVPGAFVWGDQPPPPEPPPDSYRLLDIIDQLPQHRTLRYATRNLDQINLSVLHYSWVTPPLPDDAHEIAQIQSIARGHIRAGWPGIGYHFVIGPSGTVYQVNTLETVSYHAAPNNTRSVGVCVLEREKPPTDAQVQAAALLLMGLNYELKLHKELSQTACPGQYLGPLVRAAMVEPPEPPPEPPPDPPPSGFHVTYIDGGPYIIGNFTRRAVLARWDPWQHPETMMAGDKPEYGEFGFLFSAPVVTTYEITDTLDSWAVETRAGQTAVCVWG